MASRAYWILLLIVGPLVGNGFITAFGGVFGSNSTQNSFGADINTGVTSQNNNNCDGHTC